MEWYAEGLVSQGKAAELAGLSRPELLDELAKRKVSVIQMSVEELQAELAGEQQLAAIARPGTTRSLLT